MNRDEQPDVLQLLIMHELAIMELYGIFAAIFTKQEVFWHHLAAEEQKHANLLEDLQSDAIVKAWLHNQSRIHPQAVRTSISYIESQRARAKKGELTAVQALSIAREIENALLERQFSKLKATAPKEIQPVFATLAAETERHLQMAMTTIAEAKRTSL